MSSKPKIVVLKLREILYTFVLLFLVAVLILCLILMFRKKPDPAASNVVSTQGTYTPGIYTAPLSLGDSVVDVEVTVDQNQIHGIRLVHLNDAVAAAYPLVTSSLDHIASQILEKQSLAEIRAPQENRYTAQLLFSAIAKALDLAQNTTTLTYH